MSSTPLKTAPAASSRRVAVRIIENILQCPCCRQSEYLHHSTIDVFERAEDATQCLHAHINRGGVKTEVSTGRDNPSMRRHGLSVELWCENCEATSRLTLAQHKGTTIMEHFCIDPMHGGEL